MALPESPESSPPADGRTPTPGIILIAGFPSSGTDLVRQVLNAHPQVHIAGEFPLLHRLAEQVGSEVPPEQVPAVMNQIRELDIYGNLCRDAAPLPATDHNPVSIATIYASLLTHNSFQWVGNKTPQNTEHLTELIRLFPDMRVVLVVRDPRDVALSWQNKWGKSGLLAAHKWNRRMALGTAAMAAPPLCEGRCVTIRFEDLLSDPATQCRRMCALLGVAFDPSMLRHEQQAGTRIDGKINYGQPLISGNTGKWRQQLSDQAVRRIEQVAWPMMQQFGYPPELADGPRGITRLEKACGRMRDAWAMLAVGNRASRQPLATRLRMLLVERAKRRPSRQPTPRVPLPDRRPRVGILHQGFVPEYRLGLYQGLAQQAGVSYRVYHGQPLPGSGHRAADPPFAFDHTAIKNRWLRVFGRWVVWQPLFLRTLRECDALVVGHEVKFLSSMALVFWFKLIRRPVAWWGHGYTKTEKVTGPAAVLHRLAATSKSTIANLADTYLVYSDDGKRRLINAGMPETRITVVPNTLDVEPHIKAARDIADTPEPEVRRQLGLSHAGPVLLFCGRLYPEKQPERLLQAVQTINASRTTPVHAVVIGDGPMRSALEARYESDPAVHITGPIYDTPQLARWFRVASAVVLPGKVGLGICHSFAHATPVVTCDTPFHAPEIAYLEDEVNGLFLVDTDAALAAGLSRLLDEPGLLDRLARGAEATCARLSQAAMTTAFHRGVVGMLAARGRWRDTESHRPAPPRVI